jgi:hypothetical protein
MHRGGEDSAGQGAATRFVDASDDSAKLRLIFK